MVLSSKNDFLFKKSGLQRWAPDRTIQTPCTSQTNRLNNWNFNNFLYIIWSRNVSPCKLIQFYRSLLSIILVVSRVKRLKILCVYNNQNFMIDYTLDYFHDWTKINCNSLCWCCIEVMFFPTLYLVDTVLLARKILVLNEVKEFFNFWKQYKIAGV